MGVDMAAAVGAHTAVVARIMLVLAGMGVVVTGMPVTGMAGAVAGIMVVTAAVGELAPR